jgi:hypothetical protein
LAPTTTTTAKPAQPSASGFVHPGILVDLPQLDLVRSKISAGQEPWASAFANIQNSGSSTKTALRPTSYRFSSLSYVPAPVPVIYSAGPGNTTYLEAHPELPQPTGDVEHLDDARAALAQALMWYMTGNAAYAQKAIQIMNAWSYTLTSIPFDQPRRVDNNSQVYDQGKLQAGWGTELFTRAAEIIRYTYSGWTSADIAQFSQMLDQVYLPLTISGWTGGANWLSTLADATMDIGIFTDDHATFDSGVSMWRQWTPSIIYLPSDGPTPVPPSSVFSTATALKSYWYNPSSYVSGLEGETLRDLSHMMMGLGSMSAGAETARIQGVDLWSEQKNRIIAGYELNAGYVNAYLDQLAALGGAQPSATWKPPGWVGATFTVGGTAYTGGWEVAYNTLVKRMGASMPNTAKVVQRLRPSGVGMQNSWDTLTNAISP